MRTVQWFVGYSQSCAAITRVNFRALRPPWGGRVALEEASAQIPPSCVSLGDAAVAVAAGLPRSLSGEPEGWKPVAVSSCSRTGAAGASSGACLLWSSTPPSEVTTDTISINLAAWFFWQVGFESGK